MKTEELNQNHVSLLGKAKTRRRLGRTKQVCFCIRLALSLLGKAKTGGASAEPNKFVSALGLHRLCHK